MARLTTLIGVTAILLLASTGAALAHAGHVDGVHSFEAGLLHSLTSFDHVLVALGAGFALRFVPRPWIKGLLFITLTVFVLQPFDGRVTGSEIGMTTGFIGAGFAGHLFANITGRSGPFLRSLKRRLSFKRA